MLTLLMNKCLLQPIMLHWKIFAVNKGPSWCPTKIKTLNCAGM